MKCHILFSEKNKKNISKCRLLKILPRVLSVNTPIDSIYFTFNTGPFSVSLRKHAYSNILKISPPKPESFQIRILILFIFLLKT